MPGMTNYFRNKIVDHMRGLPYSAPATAYVALVSTTPSAGSAGTPLSGTGYARAAIPLDAVSWANTQASGTGASTGTTGTTSNSIVVDFGTAGGAWGTATNFEVWDSLTGGNRLFWGEITDGAGTPTPRSIVLADPVSFPIGALQVAWA